MLVLYFLFTDTAKQIQARFPAEYDKFAEQEDHDKVLPGKSSRRKLSIIEWLQFTTGLSQSEIVIIA